jgi:hypothetical protein
MLDFQQKGVNLQRTLRCPAIPMQSPALYTAAGKSSGAKGLKGARLAAENPAVLHNLHTVPLSVVP